MQQKNVFKVYGLDCAEEVAILKKVVGAHPSVQDLGFDVLNAKFTVTYNSDEITSDAIISMIATTGMRAVLWEERDKQKGSFWQRHGREIMTSLSGFFLIAGAISQWIIQRNIKDIFGGHSDEIVPHISVVFYFLAIFAGAWFVLPKAFKSLKLIRPDMNLLLVVAVIGAVAIKQLFEAATVTFLFAIANLLEHWSVNRARRAISALMDLSPTLAREMDPKTGKITEKHVEEVSVGSIVFVKPGEKIPLDGVVLNGISSVNQAPITGESIPVSKIEGDEVFAGTINEEGALEIKITKKSSDTTIAKIINLVKEASGRRAASEQWVEKFAKYYTPIMFLFALLLAVVPSLFFGEPWMEWIYKGLVILVIACPCALVISTPVSIVSGLTASARNGVLIKGGMFLEIAGKLKALALDKTGTLTYGKPEVQRIVPLSGHDEKELLEIAYSLEKPSEHPLARAVLKKAEENNISGKKAEDFQIIKGKGAEAKIQGKRYWIGSHRFMHEQNLETEEIHNIAAGLEDEGHSVVAIGNDDHVCGLISIADQPRAFIHETILAMKGEGVERVVMLTGDNTPTAKALALLTGVDEYHAELLPEDKVSKVEKLVQKWKTVAMIGDGVNDAPAMAVSTIGIAMGAMGTDAAIETADIALMTDDLSKVPWLIRHSRRVLRIIKENIIFSLSIKFVFIVLALLGLASLWMAIAADTGAALLVVFNGLRSLKTRMTGIPSL